MGETGNFSACADWKRQLDTRFYQESTSAKTENGNFPANVLGLLGLIAASLVLPHYPHRFDSVCVTVGAVKNFFPW
jgi:hypothetical protein